MLRGIAINLFVSHICKNHNKIRDYTFAYYLFKITIGQPFCIIMQWYLKFILS